MFRRIACLTATLSTIFSVSISLSAQEADWRISPTNINIQLGSDRALQVLDDSAQELREAAWTVDNPEIGAIDEQDGRAVLHAAKVGTVRVTAAVNGEMRSRDITIWPADKPIPNGLTTWGMDPIGRDIGDLAAVPTSDGPNSYSLEQTAGGSTYLRAVREDGIQVWSWLLPEHTHNVELVCGDWLGGALLSANHNDSFTLYTVGKDGTLHWKRVFPGIRKAHAYSANHLIHILSQSQDGTITTLTGLEEETGAQRFEMTLPGSREDQVNVKSDSARVVCSAKPATSPTRTLASRLFVNIDGFAYLAFTQSNWTLSAGKCNPGAPVAPGDVRFQRRDQVVLWQIHPDGTYRSTVVEDSKSDQRISDVANVPSPTGAIIPDPQGGVLLSIRWSRKRVLDGTSDSADELVYRVDEAGNVDYKFPLPRYDGSLHDEMVLGNNDIGFATRGSMLIAFDTKDGKELWRWDANTADIEVFAALANGDCLVQTPTALVDVANANTAKEVFQGQAMMDWSGNIYRKH